LDKKSNIVSIYAHKKEPDELKDELISISKKLSRSIRAKKTRATNNNSQKISHDEDGDEHANRSRQAGLYNSETARKIGSRSKMAIKCKKAMDSIDLHNTSREYDNGKVAKPNVNWSRSAMKIPMKHIN
jgi:hypothetical protein